MKYLPFIIIIIVLTSCTSARKTLTTVRLDSSKSYISGGDGKGSFIRREWTQISGDRYPIINPDSAVASTQIKQGTSSWKCTLWDNQGQLKSDTITLTVKE